MSRPKEYARELASALESAARDVGSGRVTIKRYLRTIVNESGWKKRSPKNVVEIADALSDVGVYPDVDVTDMRIPFGSWVRLSDRPFPPRTASRPMAREEDLNDFLTAHYEQVFSGIDGLRDLELVASEKQIPFQGQKKKVDLVFQDPDGTLVGVELERDGPKEESVLQLRWYLDALSGHRRQGEGDSDHNQAEKRL